MWSSRLESKMSRLVCRTGGPHGSGLLAGSSLNPDNFDSRLSNDLVLPASRANPVVATGLGWILGMGACYEDGAPTELDFARLPWMRQHRIPVSPHPSSECPHAPRFRSASMIETRP